MSQPDDPSWLPWIVPGGTVVAAAWAFLRRFFNMATREELRAAVEAASKRIDQLHQQTENRIEARHREHKQDSEDLKEELSEVRAAIARVEGQLSGRYPRIEK